MGIRQMLNSMKIRDKIDREKHVVHFGRKLGMEDMRETAIEAYIKCCEYEYEKHCMDNAHNLPLEETKECKGRECQFVKQFIQRLDEI